MNTAPPAATLSADRELTIPLEREYKDPAQKAAVTVEVRPREADEGSAVKLKRWKRDWPDATTLHYTRTDEAAFAFDEVTDYVAVVGARGEEPSVIPIARAVEPDLEQPAREPQPTTAERAPVADPARVKEAAARLNEAARVAEALSAEVTAMAGAAATGIQEHVQVAAEPEAFTHAGPEIRSDEEHREDARRDQDAAPAVEQKLVDQPGEPEYDCSAVTAERTPCGLLVTLPERAPELNQVRVVLKAAGGDTSEWISRRAGDRGFELLPPPGVDLPAGAFWMQVHYPCKDERRCAELEVPAAAARRDDCCDVFKLPLRVETATSGGGTAGGAGGGDLGAWTTGIIDRLLPGASRTVEPGRLREGLAKLLPPSPDGVGIHAATMATAGAGLAPTPVAWPATAWAGGAAGGGWASGSPGGPGAAMTGLRPLVGLSVSGPFASFRTAADVLEIYALTALRDIQPLLQTADVDVVEAERAMVDGALLSLIAEFRREDGPEQGAADIFAADVTTHLGSLGTALGVRPPATAQQNAASSEDYENIGRFDALERWINDATSLLANWTAGADPRAELIDLRDLLAVVVESVEELEAELEAARVDERERRTIMLPPGSLRPISLAALLDWIKGEAGQRMPGLLGRVGARAAGNHGSVTKVLEKQRDLVAALLPIQELPWTHPPVNRAATSLRDQLDAAATSAGNI